MEYSLEVHKRALSRTCRVCGSKTVDTKSKKKEYRNKEGNVRKYKDLIKFVFEIDISDDDPLRHPVKCCHLCGCILQNSRVRDTNPRNFIRFRENAKAIEALWTPHGDGTNCRLCKNFKQKLFGIVRVGKKYRRLWMDVQKALTEHKLKQAANPSVKKAEEEKDDTSLDMCVEEDSRERVRTRSLTHQSLTPSKKAELLGTVDKLSECDTKDDRLNVSLLSNGEADEEIRSFSVGEAKIEEKSMKSKPGTTSVNVLASGKTKRVYEYWQREAYFEYKRSPKSSYSWEFHQKALQMTCRTCGEQITSIPECEKNKSSLQDGYKSTASLFIEQIKIRYKLHISNDDPLRHPKKICKSCSTNMNIRKPTASHWIRDNAKAIKVLWSPHGDGSNCRMCENYDESCHFSKEILPRHNRKYWMNIQKGLRELERKEDIRVTNRKRKLMPKKERRRKLMPKKVPLLKRDMSVEDGVGQSPAHKFSSDQSSSVSGFAVEPFGDLNLDSAIATQNSMISTYSTTCTEKVSHLSQDQQDKKEFEITTVTHDFSKVRMFQVVAPDCDIGNDAISNFRRIFHSVRQNQPSAETSAATTDKQTDSVSNVELQPSAITDFNEHAMDVQTESDLNMDFSVTNTMQTATSVNSETTEINVREGDIEHVEPSNQLVSPSTYEMDIGQTEQINVSTNSTSPLDCRGARDDINSKEVCEDFMPSHSQENSEMGTTIPEGSEVQTEIGSMPEIPEPNIADSINENDYGINNLPTSEMCTEASDSANNAQYTQDTSIPSDINHFPETALVKPSDTQINCGNPITSENTSQDLDSENSSVNAETKHSPTDVTLNVEITRNNVVPSPQNVTVMIAPDESNLNTESSDIVTSQVDSCQTMQANLENTEILADSMCSDSLSISNVTGGVDVFDMSTSDFKFCHNCMRVSENIANCDKCGTQLTSDSHSNPQEAKRARTDNSESRTNGGSVNGGVVNGGKDSSSASDRRDSSSRRGTPTMNGSASSSPSNVPSNSGSSGGGAVPVPQALYLNRNVITTSANEAPVVRPQAIYMNVNNQSSSARSTPTTGSLATTSSTTSTASASTAANSSGPTLRSATQNQDSRQNMSASSNLLNAAALATSIPTPTGSASGFTGSSQYPASNSANARTAASGNFPPNATVGSANNQQPNANSVTVLSNMVSIPAQQIRIGAQKFKPLTSVQFKDDGILFTLKDYTYAPVLLNARAILKCKANLNLFQFPLFLLYLEGSCMKQIRNIFGLREDEFSADSPCEMKRCITILPAITKESTREMLAKNENVDRDLRNMFSMMEMRYERYNKILEEISPEEGCDILLSLLGSRTAPGRAPTAASAAANSASSTAPPSRARPASSALMQSYAASHAPTATATQAAPQRSRMAVPGAGSGGSRGGNVLPVAHGHVDAAAAAGFGASALNNNMGSGRPPTLVIPSDANRWREMQRSLVVGGVYHVQTSANSATQYCLWNGTQLVPCRVQNAEVQMDCEQIWLGSLRTGSGQPTKVRIKADQNAGFHFTLAIKGRPTNIFIPHSAIPQCQVCRHSSLSAIFLDITPNFAATLRPRLNMHSDTDPTLNPLSKEVRRQRVVLFMKFINNDQWEALVTMQSSRRYQQQEIDIIKALKILADCKNTTKHQQKITDWLNQKTPKPNLVVLENLANDLSRPEDTPAADADDDDDVIMTQEEVGVKCPYTQQVMKEPVQNKICGHNYEKAAIYDFILRKRGTAKCPYAGCGNTTPLNQTDLELNHQLQDIIRKMK